MPPDESSMTYYNSSRRYLTKINVAEKKKWPLSDDFALKEPPEILKKKIKNQKSVNLYRCS